MVCIFAITTLVALEDDLYEWRDNFSQRRKSAAYRHVLSDPSQEPEFHIDPSFRFTNQEVEDNSAHRQAEQFYLQKQIQSQTPMVIVLEDGERVEGCIEWYDRSVLKIRGRSKVLVYKSAIKYMYKLGEAGQ